MAVQDRPANGIPGQTVAAKCKFGPGPCETDERIYPGEGWIGSGRCAIRHGKATANSLRGERAEGEGRPIARSVGHSCVFRAHDPSADEPRKNARSVRC